MEMDVLRPMEQWLRLYKTFPMKLQRIEKERLTYDHERRLYNKVASQVRAPVGPPPPAQRPPQLAMWLAFVAVRAFVAGSRHLDSWLRQLCKPASQAGWLASGGTTSLLTWRRHLIWNVCIKIGNGQWYEVCLLQWH